MTLLEADKKHKALTIFHPSVVRANDTRLKIKEKKRKKHVPRPPSRQSRKLSPFTHKILRKFPFSKNHKFQNMPGAIVRLEKGRKARRTGKPEETKRGGKMGKRELEKSRKEGTVG